MQQQQAQTVGRTSGAPWNTQNIFRYPHLTFGSGQYFSGDMNASQSFDPNRPKMKDEAIQTDYRDAEVQTDPYSPQYVIPEGMPEPMIVSLAPFTYGRGLPAGAYEVAQIEKAQARREKEEALPTTNDPRAFKQRVAHFAQCELDDWMEREEEVRERQERRIQLLREALATRDRSRSAATQERVQKTREEKTQKKDEAVHAIERERVKALRHFTIEAREPEGRKARTKDKIRDYFNFDSKAYAPLPRDGQVGERPTSQVIVRNNYTETLNGLDILERDLKLDILTRPARLPVKARPRSQAERDQLKIDQHIREMEAAIRTQKQKGGKSDREGTTPGRADEKKEPRKRKGVVQRPKTPECPPGEDDDVFEACLLLQRLLRGRAVQTMMLEGKAKRADLIRELRLAEQMRAAGEGAGVLDAEMQAELKEKQELVARQILQGALGDVVGQTMNELSKELIRIREQRRISAMVQIAERQRRVREAEESGRRQEEEEKRAREDERIRQVTHTQQRTVDAFLESIMEDSCDAAAKKHAVMEMRVLAGRLGDVLYQVEKRNPETVVRDLVSSFLFPEVERGLLREQVKRDQKRFIETARQQLKHATDVTAKALAGDGKDTMSPH